MLDAIGMINHQHNRFASEIVGNAADTDQQAVLQEVERGLHYVKGLFNGLRIRLTSLDRRVTNAIQLVSFLNRLLRAYVNLSCLHL